MMLMRRMQRGLKVAKSSHGATRRADHAVSDFVSATYRTTSIWAIEELNLGPHAYQACALTT